MHIHVPSRIPVKHLERSTGMTILAGVLCAVGLVAFFLTLSRDADQAWRAWVVNWLFFTSISMGAVMVAVVTWLVKAKWNWSVRRVSLSFAAFLPISFVLFLPMLFLGGDYFPWVEEMAHDPILQNKQAWLNLPFLVSRNVLGLLLLCGMAMYFAYHAVRPDAGLADGAGDAEPRRAKTRARYMQQWLGQDAEEARSYHRMTRLAPALILCYAVVMSVISFDWIMSLEPHWFSTIFGAWFFMGAFWAGFALTALVTVLLKRSDPELDALMGAQQLWDLGKLMFAFTVFWTYLFWSQYIVIWYGKLPWEQAWIINRSVAPWGWMSLLVLFLCFIFPFAGLIGKRPKMNPGWLAGMACVILVGQWLWQYVMVVPALHHGGPAISVWEPAIGLLFLGLLIFAVRRFLETHPVIQVWQPMVDPESLESEIGEEASAWKRHPEVAGTA